MNVYYNQISGRYDLMHPDRLQWQIKLRVDDKIIYECFDSERDIDGWLPTEVAELILERSNYYLYNSRQAVVKETVEWIREHASEVNDSYLLTQIANHKKQIDRLESYLSEDYNG
jgi:hypothetical protein